MRRNAFQLSRRHKAALYAASLTLFASGVAWWALDSFAAQPDEFGGTGKHPAEAWMLRAHGAAAMAILVLLGTVLPVHVKRAWQTRQNLTSGLTLLAGFGLLTVTGYALYYAGGEKLRALASSIHWWLGLALPLLLGWHVVRGHWLRRHGRLRQ